MKPEKINVVTLGCAKNIVDSEILLKQLELQGYIVMHGSIEYQTDTVIINTCGFINDAKEESINAILKFAEAKSKGLIKKLIVIGCLSQKYMSELQKEIPEVDFYSGVNSYKKVLRYLGHNPVIKHLNDRIITGQGHYAYLKISEGCNRSCAFCTIPLIRGKHNSRPLGNILDETSLLAAKGVKELILIAQDLNYYGLDLYKKRMLPHLIKKIISKNEFEWIRLQYLYPSGLPESLLEIIKSNSKICKYIDIPIQHISNKILRLMKRNYSRYFVENLLWHIREKIPDVAIRTTLIVGHPGETKKEYEELKKFIIDFQFNRLGVFKYSHEDGTYSFNNYRDEVPGKTKEERAAELMEIQQDISLKQNYLKLNQVVKVLVDGVEGEYFTGRTEFDSPEVDHEVLVKKKYNLIPGSFYNVRITDATEFDLYGVPVS